MTPLASLESLEVGACREFEWRGEPCFLVRTADGVHAYRNRCPHRGVTLNWQQDQFLSELRDAILCAIHAARFRLSEGLCLSGPCAGDALTVLRVAVRDGVIWLTE